MEPFLEVRMSDAPPPAGPPIFLVGAERSGTTLLRLMLDHHPQIAFQFEFELAVDDVSDDGRWPTLAQFLRKMRKDRVFLASKYAVDHSLGYPELVCSFLEQKRLRDRKPLVGATVHRNFHRLTHIWPDARFLHICRDGRDVARSCVAMGWAGNMWTAVQRWVEAESLWNRMKATVPSERRFEVHYEQLVGDPKRLLQEICAFLGVPFDPAMFDYTRTSTYEYPDPKLASQWRHTLSQREIRLVEARAAELLMERGYELSGLPRLEISPPEAWALRAHDRVSRASRRLREYGPRLFLENVVARRAGSNRWRERVQMQINEIENSQLK